MNTPLSAPLRIGSVPYANTWPLTFFLAERFPGSSVERYLPSQLPFRLIAHHLDVALMPIAALMELSNGTILGNACIGCRGPVASVLLYSKRPIESIRQVALDVSSRSSVLLGEVIFREFYGLDPKKHPLPLDVDLAEQPGDAFLLIGDPAMRYIQSAPWEYRYDLGELWQQHTGLPFVFAAWIACRDKHRDDASIAAALQSVRDQGTAAVDRIVEHYAESAFNPYPGAPERMRVYLSESVRFVIGPEERAAIELYFDLAAKHRLIPRRAPVDFVEGNG